MKLNKLLYVFLLSGFLFHTVVYSDIPDGYSRHIDATDPVEGGPHNFFGTSNGYSDVRIRGIANDVGAVQGWTIIPEGASVKWKIRIMVCFNTENVDHCEIRVWVPSTNDTLWDRVVYHNEIVSEVGTNQEVVYEGDGWFLYSYDAPKGDYFKPLSSETPTIIDIRYFVWNPVLPQGRHDIVKLHYTASGNFTGDEVIDYVTEYAGGGNYVKVPIEGSLVYYFDVGTGYAWSGSYGGNIWTSDVNGIKKTKFGPHEIIYLNGNQHYSHWSFQYPMTVPLYIVEDKDWNEGDPLNGYTRYGSQEVTIYDGGQIHEAIWMPPNLQIGSYDIIVDVDQDGLYKKSYDVSIGFSVVGFFVIPEFTLGTISAVVVPLLAYIYLKNKARARPYL